MRLLALILTAVIGSLSTFASAPRPNIIVILTDDQGYGDSGRFVAVSTMLLAGEAAGFMDGETGTFTITPSDKTGRDFRARGRLEYIGTPYPRFAGNREYFLKQGPDAPENLLSYADGTFHKDDLVKP